MPQQSFGERLGRLSGIVTTLPACMGVGWVVGYFVVDCNLGTFPWGTIIFIFLGAGAGFYQIIRLLTRNEGDG